MVEGFSKMSKIRIILGEYLLRGPKVGAWIGGVWNSQISGPEIYFSGQNSGPEIWRIHPPPFHAPDLACLFFASLHKMCVTRPWLLHENIPASHLCNHFSGVYTPFLLDSPYLKSEMRRFMLDSCSLSQRQYFSNASVTKVRAGSNWPANSAYQHKMGGGRTRQNNK